MEPKRAKLGSNDRDAMEVDDSVKTTQTVTSISLKSPETRKLSNKDVLLRLRPILLGLQDNNYETLRNNLQEMHDFLQVDSISRSEKDIVAKLQDIYLETRKVEAASLPTDGDNVNVKYQEAAIEIRNAILYSNLEEIPGGEGIKVYKGIVPDVQRPGALRKVFIRPEDQTFWDRCISLAMEGQPVCGVGNPGIGKTTTSLYLLQQIVRERRKPVVYTIRKKMGSKDVFYEFTPIVENNHLTDVTVKVYEIMPTEKLHKIPSIQNENAVYFVDPGTYEHSCDDTDENFEAKFIMAASNDSRHWGGNNFTKFRGSVTPMFGLDPGHSSKPGILVYGSLWTGRQVILTKPYLPDIQDLSDNEVLRRFRVVGGSLRDIIMFDEKIFKERVVTALALDQVTVNELVDGRYKCTFQPDAPSSILIGIGPRDNDLTDLKITLRSDYVEECLAYKYLKTSWYSFLDEDNAGNRGNIFESYIRAKFSRGPVQFSGNEARESVRERPPNGKKNEKKNYEPVNMITIGSNRTIARVSNMIEAVCADLSQEYMYYSKDESEPLIDMIFQVDDGFHAIQSTVRTSHDGDADKIKNLQEELQLGSGKNLKIFYAVPLTRYGKFVTEPVNPLSGRPDLKNVFIYHVGVSGSNDLPP